MIFRSGAYKANTPHPSTLMPNANALARGVLGRPRPAQLMSQAQLHAAIQQGSGRTIDTGDITSGIADYDSPVMR